MKLIRALEHFLTNEPKWAAELDKLETELDDEIDKLIADTAKARVDHSQVSTDTNSASAPVPDKLDNVLATLKDRRDKLHIQPEFTHLIVGICGQILAFGSAGIGFMIAFSNKIPAFTDFWRNVLAVCGLFYLNIMLIALITLVWFFMQSRSRYPFLFLRKLGNAYPYFYLEALQRENRKFSWRPIQSPKNIFRTNKMYLEDLKKYFEYSLTETKEEKLKAEIRQMFLLINYQGFLDHYEMQLGHIFLYGLVGSLVSLFLIYNFVF